jgi:Post-segregation antitoxin CcdA
MTEEQRSEKLRLNITVDKEIVELAKDMGFNISAAFEEYLRVLTYKPHGKSSQDVVNAYEKFYVKIVPILGQFDIEIELGEITDEDYSHRRKTKINFKGSKIVLDHTEPSILKDGKYYQLGEFDKDKIIYLTPDDLKYLYHPKVVLRNLIDELKLIAADNTIQVQKLNLAARFVDALFNDLKDSSESGSETPSLRRIIDATIAEIEDVQPSSQEEKKEAVVA